VITVIDQETVRPSDTASLVRAASAGDDQAWTRLVERYRRAVETTARNVGLGPADVADVAQTTWLRLFQHLGSLRQPERVGAWLVTTARHEAIRVSRRSQRETVTGDEVDAEAESYETAELDRALLDAERDDALRGAFRTLTPRCQKLLHLLVGQESTSYASAAAELHMPIGSLGPTRARCIECLRKSELAATFGP
jgi:RNA polymerase sigma factor (sigma-70 family)